MKKILAATILGISVLMVLFLLTGCQPSVAKVKIGYLKVDASLPLFVAQQNNYFAEQGLQIETHEFTSSTTLIDALVTGQIDVSASGAIGSLLALEENSPNRYRIFILNLHNLEKRRFSDYLLVKAESKIETPNDLFGRKIGVPQGPMASGFAEIILKGIFNDTEAAKIVPLSFSDLPNALLAASVDAIIVNDPAATILIEEKAARSLIEAPQEKYIMDPLPASAFALSVTFLNKKPKEAKKTVNAFTKAVDFIRNDDIESRDILIHFTGIDRIVGLKMNLRDWQKPEEIDKQAVTKLAKLLVEVGVLKNPGITYEGIYYSD